MEDEIGSSGISTLRSFEPNSTVLQSNLGSIADLHEKLPVSLHTQQSLSINNRMTLPTLFCSSKSFLGFTGGVESRLSSMGTKLQGRLTALELELKLSSESPRLMIPDYTEMGPLLSNATEARENEDEVTDIPQLKWCAFCSRETCAEVVYRPTKKTFWSSVGIFFMGGVLGCFMMPYITENCKKMKFVCMRCGHNLE